MKTITSKVLTNVIVGSATALFLASSTSKADAFSLTLLDSYYLPNSNTAEYLYSLDFRVGEVSNLTTGDLLILNISDAEQGRVVSGQDVRGISSLADKSVINYAASSYFNNGGVTSNSAFFNVTRNLEQNLGNGTSYSTFVVQTVPEPSTAFGSFMLLGFGALLKRQYSRKCKKFKHIS